MSNITNVKVKQGNVLSLSGSSVEITGSITTTGNLKVGGTLEANEIVVSQLTSASVVYSSGSSKFGDNANDKHDFTGSVNISGNLVVVSGNITANLNGTASNADLLDGLDSTAFARLASSNTFTNTNTFNTVYITASVGITGSDAKFTTITGSTITGNVATITSITGSLAGNATSATTASNVTLTATDSTNASFNITFVDGPTGTRPLRTDTGLTYNPSNNSLTASAISASQITGSFSGSFLGTISQVQAGNNIVVTNGSGPTATVALTSSITSNLTNLTASNIASTNSFLASGSFFVAQRTISSDYTIDASGQDHVIFADASSAPVAITIPGASTTSGRQLIIKKTDSTTNVVAVSASAGSIGESGEESRGIYGPGESITIISNGIDIWHIV